jgi:hypothetical protein
MHIRFGKIPIFQGGAIIFVGSAFFRKLYLENIRVGNAGK